MKKIVKQISLLLALIMLACTLFGCNGDTADTDNTGGSSEATSDTAGADNDGLLLVREGTPTFRVVVGANAEKHEKDTAKAVLELLKKNISSKFVLAEDTVKAEDGMGEIVVGNTNRTQPTSVSELAEYTQYYIMKLEGGSIWISASDETQYAQALTLLTLALKNNTAKDGQGNTYIRWEDKMFSSKSDSDYSYNGVALENFRIVYAQDQLCVKREENAKLLQEYIRQTTGITLTVSSDISAAKPNEILMGATNRDSDSAGTGKELLEYGIKFDGSRIKLLGGAVSVMESVKLFNNGLKTCGGKLESIGETHGNFQNEPVQKKADGTVRIMSWNILAEMSSWGGTPVEERVETAAEVILDYAPDAMILNEVTDSWADMLRATLGAKYELVRPQEKKTDNTLGQWSYSALIYDKTKYDLVASASERYTKGSATTGRAMTWAVLAEKGTKNNKFAVISTHWDTLSQPEIDYYGPDFPTWRRLQATELANKVKAIKSEYGVDAFCAGDFNVPDTHEHLQAFLEESGYVNSRAVALSKKNAEYGSATGKLGNPAVANSANFPNFDHILIPTGKTVKYYETIIYSYTRSVSDHCPVLCDVVL